MMNFSTSNVTSIKVMMKKKRYVKSFGVRDIILISGSIEIWIIYKICLSVCSEMKRIAFRPGDTVLKSRPFAFVIIASHR